jgi:ribosome recycling factor
MLIVSAPARVSAGLLEHILVPAYGTPTALSQLGALTARDAKTLVVNLYDASLAAAVESAIRASPLGLSPRVDGDQVVVPVPPPSAEARASVTRLAAAAGEAARATGRRVRADANDELRRAEAGASKDEVRRRERDVQAAADAFAKDVAAAIAAKEKELKSSL